MDGFAGKGVVITGAGTGIGRATAHRFAAEGARVLVVGRTAARLEETAAAHSSISVFAADGAAADGPERIVEAAMRRLGRIDVLVNNAAITRPAALGAIDRRTAEEQIATNLLAPLFLAQAALPHLASAQGTIVNVSSNPPWGGWPDNSVYGSTKVALDFLTATWAVELAPKGVRVVSVAPGITATPVLAHAGYTPEQIAAAGEGLVGRIPLGRVAQPAEIAWWIVNVTRPEAAYLTGTVVRVDGGLSVAAGQPVAAGQ
ncbi:SDR family NAD(P)-dependent oxidoreductase [Nonomuraea roseoviolacea]|uniref:NAD(P)-dependent dehydrogenase (Short-subunit alcohol dehydrogenase family) n=1 Tax=Nonomuraea roseoviolacea subsp. carminata TaxID=160689 RepID=A0ABT1JXG1_9ACTN|nr:SDR family oxidoreductase [Nonomuraea roseoviolacea]MCP2346441.1 NAD(P)-dependent dehydrogenase (short-subunit alcohol dehydrogenase family) [Nonomuraea roseoviolacea subsp. carminata]